MWKKTTLFIHVSVNPTCTVILQLNLTGGNRCVHLRYMLDASFTCCSAIEFTSWWNVSYRTSSWPRWTTNTWIRMFPTLLMLSGEGSLAAALAHFHWLPAHIPSWSDYVCLLLISRLSAPLKMWQCTSGTAWRRFCHPTCSMRLRFMRRTKTLLYIEESRRLVKLWTLECL